MSTGGAIGRVVPLRKTCACGNDTGITDVVNGQITVRCCECNTFRYNLPKGELGLPTRHVSNRGNIQPSQRSRILHRGNNMCEVCGQTEGILHVGHILSVADGTDATNAELNSDDNLGRLSFSPWFYLRLLRARQQRVVV